MKWRFTEDMMRGLSPAVDTAGTIYVVGKREAHDQEGQLYAFSQEGTLKWTFRPGGTPSIGKDGTIYFSSTADSAVYAISSDGTLQWRFPIGTEDLALAPTVGLDSTVYLGGSDNLHAISTKGVLKWRWSPEGVSHVSGMTFSHPVGPEGTIYLGLLSGLHAVTPAGKAKWTNENGGGTPAVSSRGIIYGTPNLTAYFSDGSKKWTHEDNRIEGVAIGREGTVYATSDSTFDDRSLYLKAIDPQTGQTKWTHRIGRVSTTVGPVIGTGRTIYVATDSALVAVGDVATTATPRGLDELPSELLLGANYPNPFNPVTVIPYELPEATGVRLEIFDLLGRRLQVVVDAKKPAGQHRTRVRAGSLPSGTYLYRLTAEGRIRQRVMTVAK